MRSRASFCCGSGIEKGAAVSVGAEIVEPHEAAAERKLVVCIFAGEEIDEFRRAGFNRSAGFFVLGNNGVAEEDECGVLVRGKKFGSVLPCRRRRLRFVDHLMDEFRSFRGDDLEDGAGGRADGEISEHIAAGDSRHVGYSFFTHQRKT